MMDFSLKNQDLTIINGDLAMCSTDKVALAQAISIRLKTLSGEWFMDTSVGVPYFNEIFGQKRSFLFIRQIILPHVEAMSGVKEVTNFSVQEQDNRAIFISFSIILNDGSSIQINESVGA